MAELTAGDHVTASIQLLRPLGAGGMGAVWVARHLGLHTDVVVKFITSERATDPDAIARFQREAASASEVKTPHVVQMIDHGVATNGTPYIAMELLEGESLDARLTRQRLLAPNEVAGLVLQVSRALSRAHEKRIIHRDIKPENIFLCETGEDEAFVKVLDFGIAKSHDASSLSATVTGTLVGTPFFMSPEQIVGSKQLDHRTDLWSLGVVAFICLTGTRPFQADTVGGLAIAICKGELPLPSKANPRLSAELDRWFLRACAREPGERFQSARAMADALVAITGGVAEARIPSLHTAGDHRTERQIELRAPIAHTLESGSPADSAFASTAGAHSPPGDAPPGITPLVTPTRVIGVAAAISVVVVALLMTRRPDVPPSTPASSPAATAIASPAAPPEAAPSVEPPPAEPSVEAPVAASAAASGAKSQAVTATPRPAAVPKPKPSPTKPIDEPIE